MVQPAVRHEKRAVGKHIHSRRLDKAAVAVAQRAENIQQIAVVVIGEHPALPGIQDAVNAPAADTDIRQDGADGLFVGVGQLDIAIGVDAAHAAQHVAAMGFIFLMNWSALWVLMVP